MPVLSQVLCLVNSVHWCRTAKVCSVTGNRFPERPTGIGHYSDQLPSRGQPEIMIVPILYGVTVVPLTGLMALLFLRIQAKG